MKKIGIKKPNKIAILSAAIIIVALVAASVFIYIPFLNRNKSLRSEILHERDRNILVGKIRALGRHLKIYEKALPKARGISWLLGEVSDMATQENIEISSIKPEAPEDRGLYIKLSIVLNTVSTYNQIGRFISRIESSEKFLRVESVDIKRYDLDEGFNAEIARFKPFDTKAHIVISTVVFKE